MGLIEESGKINPECKAYKEQINNGDHDQYIEPQRGKPLPKPCLEFHQKISRDNQGRKRILLNSKMDLYLSQLDIRELQKAKGAIKAAVYFLMANLGLDPADLTKVILTGSFGDQVNIKSILDIGMIPPVNQNIV